MAAAAYQPTQSDPCFTAGTGPISLVKAARVSRHSFLNRQKLTLKKPSSRSVSADAKHGIQDSMEFFLEIFFWFSPDVFVFSVSIPSSPSSSYTMQTSKKYLQEESYGQISRLSTCKVALS